MHIQRTELQQLRRIAVITYLVVAETVILGLVVTLVVGLLRSHAEILHRLTHVATTSPEAVETVTARGDEVALGLAPMPSEEAVPDDVPPLPDISGLSLELEPVDIRIGEGRRHALLAFIGTGCLSCLDLWTALSSPEPPRFPSNVDVVLVTKDPDEENLAKLRELRPPGFPVVMASTAWSVCDAPGSPYFVLVDGNSRKPIGAGSATRWEQVISLMKDGLAEVELARELSATDQDRKKKSQRQSVLEREDAELRRAGVSPDDPSLYAPVAFEPTDGLPEAR